MIMNFSKMGEYIKMKPKEQLIEINNKREILEKSKDYLKKAVEELKKCVCYGYLDEEIILLKKRIKDIDFEIDEILNFQYDEILEMYKITEQDLYTYQQEKLIEEIK